MKKSKKRKHTELKEVDTDTNDLKNRARFYCKSPDQWLIVKKYGRDRLEQLVIEHDFNTQNLYMGHYLASSTVVADQITGGKGYADITLRRSS